MKSMFVALMLICVNALALPTSFTGPDVLSGKEITVDGRNKKGVVVLFLSAECPCSNSHIKEVSSLSETYKDFSFVAVHSNRDESQKLTQSYFANIKLPFPVVQDQNTKWADEFKALKTPHAYVVLSSGKVAYQGGVSSSKEFNEADRKYLREALEDLKLDQPVRTPQARTLGCVISRDP